MPDNIKFDNIADHTIYCPRNDRMFMVGERDENSRYLPDYDFLDHAKG
jgi:hypothetical protein